MVALAGNEMMVANREHVRLPAALVVVTLPAATESTQRLRGEPPTGPSARALPHHHHRSWDQSALSLARLGALRSEIVFSRKRSS